MLFTAVADLGYARRLKEADALGLLTEKIVCEPGADSEEDIVRLLIENLPDPAIRKRLYQRIVDRASELGDPRRTPGADNRLIAKALARTAEILKRYLPE